MNENIIQPREADAHIALRSSGEKSAAHVIEIFLDKHGKHLASRCSTLPVEKVNAIVEASSLWRDDKARNRKVKQAAADLGLTGLALIIVSHVADPLLIPSPILVSFEPIPLEERYAGLQDLMTTVSMQEQAAPPRPYVGRFRKFMFKYALPYMMFLNFLFQGIPQLIKHGFYSYMSLLYLALIGMSVLAIVFSRAIMTKDWYIVPGGLIVREDHFLSRKRGIQFFTNSNSLIMIMVQPPGLSVTILAQEHKVIRRFSRFECAALLAAWQSPLPTPCEQLIRNVLG